MRDGVFLNLTGQVAQRFPFGQLRSCGVVVRAHLPERLVVARHLLGVFVECRSILCM